ncbi:NAD(P)-binding domain-containing protein [Yoonia sediminilitoris]|nr:NAD(P)-binding domain-containing protein [Yoonia sediminilitoris]
MSIVGLGSMGYGMATSLVRAGHVVHGFDCLTSAPMGPNSCIC